MWHFCNVEIPVPGKINTFLACDDSTQKTEQGNSKS